ncbi:GRP family sugar transporter, partial [Staphylococcus saprophyticus]|uniref:GRP family sugar transporter n=1 Tax=Staphylococcus saprophyticus TaxID=29385 RepID=UPI001C92F01A
LLATTLFTPIFLPQSTTPIQLTLALVPILLLLIPIPLTSIKPKNQPSPANNKFRKPIPIFIISTVPYLLYLLL